MKIVISGGGIAGLTLALTAKKAGHIPILTQQRDSLDHPSFGGGIGLWPPSQMIMQRLGTLPQLQKHSLYMPNARYYDSKGNVLAHPSNNFHHRFPVLCLQRQTLQKQLYKKCKQQNIQIYTQTTVQNIISNKQNVQIKLSNGQNIRAAMLIGTDGIWSKIRNYIMQESKLPLVIPYHCQYAYFRVVVDTNLDKQNSSQWHQYAFQSWDQKKRFGYVPLKQPKTFWFVAIPIGQKGLQKIVGSHLCTQQQKQWIINQFKDWKGPINIKKLIQITPANTILRTDIHKVKDVSSFPWVSKNKNILILGDAANATAPNLAQGAGLAIESAWDIISMLNITNLQGLNKYIQKRKKRANTVQNMADLVAKVGQLSSPYNKIRNNLMKISTKYFPYLQQYIFQQTVSHSLGGNSNKLYWMPPNIPIYKFHKNIRQQNSLLGKIMGSSQFHKLPQNTRQFRSSLVGEGFGTVSCKIFPFAKLLGLPQNMQNGSFGGYVQTLYNKTDGNQYQKWTRIFGQGQIGATKYSTYHRANPNFKLSNTGLVLTQSMGIGPDIIRFGCIPVLSQNILYYTSKGLWFRNWKIPIPNFIAPISQWKQKQTQKGWEFQGQIRLAKIMGSLNIIKYSGKFQTIKYTKKSIHKNKRVIIAGGSGMIGSIVAKQFHLDGWDVQILSRKSNTIQKLPFAKIHQWNITNYQNNQQIQRLAYILQNSTAVINLSGQNPGTSRWDDKTKNKILQSRIKSIKLLSSAFNKLQGKKPIFIQASAAGVYGNRREQILVDNAQPGKQNTFRTQTCKQIQNITRELCSQAGIIRIGHVFSSQGGLFPSLQLASKMRVIKFGKGGQYAPWVHIQDLANALVFMSQNFQKFKGKSINIASPDHKTYDQILQSLAKMRKRSFCKITVPQSLLKWSLGEISSVIFDSQKMYPKLLLENGYKFKFGELEKALTSRECL